MESLSAIARLAAGLALTAVATGVTPAQSPTQAATPKASAPPPVGQKAPPTADSLRAIEYRGRRLAQYDFVAWIATDSLLARGVQLGPEVRYVVRPTSDSTWEAVFGAFNASRDAFLVSYVARQRPAAPWQLDVEAFATPRADTGFVLRAARALEEAKRDFGPQSCPYNGAVLERPDGGLFVYLVPAQVQTGVFPLGADVRYHFAPDGRQLLAKRKLHNALLQFRGASADGKTLAAGTHSAVLDDIPEDTDVFHVLVRRPRVPEYIVSQEFLYGISPTGQILLYGRSRDILRP